MEVNKEIISDSERLLNEFKKLPIEKKRTAIAFIQGIAHNNETKAS